MTGFGKTCIVHTSNFAQLEMLKPQGMVHKCETFRNDKGVASGCTIPESFILSCLSFQINFESPKQKN